MDTPARFGVPDSVPKLIFGTGNQHLALTQRDTSKADEPQNQLVPAWWNPPGRASRRGGEPGGLLFGGVRGQLSQPAAQIMLNASMPIMYDAGLLASRCGAAAGCSTTVYRSSSHSR